MIATTIKAAVPTMVRKCRGDRLMLLFTPGGTEGASPWIRAVVSFLSLVEQNVEKPGGRGGACFKLVSLVGQHRNGGEARRMLLFQTRP